MRFARTAQQEQSFQLAPMVDILFVLLIFFLVTSSFQEVEKELSVALPKAGSASDVSQAGRDVIINIKKDGTCVVNRKSYDRAGLKALLSRTQGVLGTTTILLRADKDVPYERVVAVMDVCSELKISRLSFITTKEEKTK